MILGIIPARAGSKGIPNKNIYPLCDKPLIDYTIDIVNQSNIDYFVISTDIEKLYIGKNAIKRPAYLCGDDVKTIDVVKHAIMEFELLTRISVDTVMILQPTSPLRTLEDINKALMVYKSYNTKSLYSGYYMGLKHKNKTYDKHIDKPHFQRNGAIFIASRELIEKGLLWDENVIEFEMPHYRSIDIDTMEDMKEAEMLIKGGVLGEYNQSNSKCSSGMFLHGHSTVTTWNPPNIENY